MRARLLLLAWTGGLVAAVGALVAAGSGVLAAPPLDPPGELVQWVEERGAVVAAFAVIRLGALATASYLLLATTVGAVVRLAGAASAVSLADTFTVALVRRLLQTSLAAGLTLAAVAPSAPSVVRVALAAEVSTEAPPPVATMRLIEEEPQEAPAPPAPAAPDAGGRTHEVQPGEHLWAIAERALADDLGRQPTEGEVTAYWRSLIEHNRAVLADPDNPDLIFPGQVVTLPDR